ncbi:hypothetical protein L1D38_19825 [Vibrio brasiliensis]|nr:hypothetical protein [Vibrio brasiliensis]
MAIRARIVDANTGRKPSLRQYIIRYLGYIVATLPLGLGIFWVVKGNFISWRLRQRYTRRRKGHKRDQRQRERKPRSSTSSSFRDGSVAGPIVPELFRLMQLKHSQRLQLILSRTSSWR